MNAATTTEILRYSAFTTDSTGGNPAGVILDAARLSDDRMLAVAAEVGYSESAFITAADLPRRRFRLRYFSPLAEVAFCGHATVATTVALAERHGVGEFTFDTAAGEIRVATVIDSSGAVRATLTSPPTHSRPAEDAEVDAALAALHWQRADLDPSLPSHVAFGGNYHLVLAAATRARLADLSYDFDALGDVMRAHDWTTVQLVWQESDTGFHVRDPFPPGGVVEDPATGAAAAAFGGYLRTIGRVRGAMTFTLSQGTDMGRPSTLTVEVDPADLQVRVAGHAVPIAL
ncbi:PhzF family phenazine biosynthesis isomerase [Streptomyces anthocyanicus]|uniref:PhzF family phenazine biosynthesis isomerase n=1 Tax=Streptomyces anthocyanicus TaxID=68174 RepID=UPI002F90DB01|nr:PhzF family phenazine biosynthesis protein [Streptomyces anthocyanicus]